MGQLATPAVPWALPRHGVMAARHFFQCGWLWQFGLERMAADHGRSSPCWGRIAATMVDFSSGWNSASQFFKMIMQEMPWGLSQRMMPSKSNYVAMRLQVRAVVNPAYSQPKWRCPQHNGDTTNTRSCWSGDYGISKMFTSFPLSGENLLMAHSGSGTPPPIQCNSEWSGFSWTMAQKIQQTQTLGDWLMKLIVSALAYLCNLRSTYPTNPFVAFHNNIIFENSTRHDCFHDKLRWFNQFNPQFANVTSLEVARIEARTRGASRQPASEQPAGLTWLIAKPLWFTIHESIDWFKGKIPGKSHISWEYLWFPVDFPFSQPIEWKELSLQREMNGIQLVCSKK